MLCWFLSQFLEREGGRPGREEEEWGGNQGSELDRRPGPTAPRGCAGPAAPTPIAFLDLVLLTGPHGGCGANDLGSGE